MGWFNYYGLIAVVVLLVPNIIYGIVNKGKGGDKSNNLVLRIFEQVGRYGCMAFMIFNIPYTYFNFWFDSALIVYLSVGGVLLLFYLLGWVILFKRQSLLKALWLSITPTLLFLFCGVMVSSIPLIVFACIFGAAHITISNKMWKS